MAHTLQELSLGQALSPRSVEYLRKCLVVTSKALSRLSPALIGCYPGRPPSERPTFVEQVKDLPITRQPVITTMATIHKVRPCLLAPVALCLLVHLGFCDKPLSCTLADWLTCLFDNRMLSKSVPLHVVWWAPRMAQWSCSIRVISRCFSPSRCLGMLHLHSQVPYDIALLYISIA